MQPVVAADQVPSNIVSIVLDDADYFDFGFNNGLLDEPDVLTPNMDALRDGGRLFTQYYCASAICSPTRISLLTGNTPLQHGAVDAWVSIEKVTQSIPGTSGLPRDIPQLGQMMRLMGKRTAHHGKWHVGRSRKIFRHQAMGFEEYSYHKFPAGQPRDKWHGRFRFVDQNGSTFQDVDYVDTYFADKVIDFIHRSADAGDEFFVNFWPLTPHKPWSPPRSFDNSATRFDLRTDRGKLLAMMYSIDLEIGRIMDALEARGLIDDTLVVLTSDNGGQQSVQHPSHLNGFKNTLFEGGIRVPLVAHWPNGISPGSTNHSVISSYDLLPTFVHLLGIHPNMLYLEIDGRSKAKAFTENRLLVHSPMLWQLSGRSERTDDERAQLTYAYRVADFKLVKQRTQNDLTSPNAYLLYDVIHDPFERNDLRAAKPFLFNYMKEEALKARKESSRYFGIPKSVTRKRVVIPFDPRIDINSKSMTFIMDLQVPANQSSWQNVYRRDGAQRLVLTTNGRLRWRLQGVTRGNRPISKELVSPRLSPGFHRVALVVAGFKKDNLRAELFVDGNRVDELDNHRPRNQHYTLNQTTSPAIFGDKQIAIRNARFYNNRFFPDEW